MLTIALLICSNTFMTIAWYGHLKFRSTPLFVAILLSWSIAFFEYCFQVPANRYGHADGNEQTLTDSDGWLQSAWNAKFSAPQLKIIQEVITIAAFVIFNALVLKDVVRATDWAAYALIILAVVVMMYPRWAHVHERQAAVKDPSPITQTNQGANSNRPDDSK
ncbi:MAG TPA: DMT family protein [Pirellulales bacterium]|jgi:hypothetical protein|nr:DMT family protein [Pirellulales bacterium]